MASAAILRAQAQGLARAHDCTRLVAVAELGEEIFTQRQACVGMVEHTPVTVDEREAVSGGERHMIDREQPARRDGDVRTSRGVYAALLWHLFAVQLVQLRAHGQERVELAVGDRAVWRDVEEVCVAARSVQVAVDHCLEVGPIGDLGVLGALVSAHLPDLLT
jgi:hypothetical protein